MKCIVILSIIILLLFVYFNDDDEYFTTGFGVTSGLSYYNKARRCSLEPDPYGSRSPYCESIGTVII